jgi:diguanylate cyclase (GGDEF)-like protein/PAS domain S-box-containing protein
MRLEFTPILIPLLMAAVISACLVAFTWRRRQARGAVPFIMLAAALTEWTLSYILELSGVGLSIKLTGLKLSFLGIVCVPTTWLVFTLYYSGRGEYIRWPRWLVFFLVPLATVFLVWTWDQHLLLWTEISVVDHGTYTTLDTTNGPLFYVHAIYSYALLFAGTVILLQSYLDLPRLFYQQKIILVLSMVFAWMANLLFVFDVNPFTGIDLTPFAFTISGIGIVWSLFGLRFLDLIPVARETIFRDISDGIILLDHIGRIQDLNPAAAKMLSVKSVDIIGKPIRSALLQLPVLEEVTAQMGRKTPPPAGGKRKNGPNGANKPVEFSLAVEQSQRDFDLRISSLASRAGDVTGWILELRDITEQKQTQAYLHRRTAFLEVFNQIIATATTADDLASMMQTTLTQLLDLLGVAKGGMWLGAKFSEAGLGAEVLPLLQDYLKQAAQEQSLSNPLALFVIGDWETVEVEESNLWSGLKPVMLGAGVRAAILVAVGTLQANLGYLLLASGEPHLWEDEEIFLLNAVGRQVGVVADRLIHLEEIQVRNQLMIRLIEQSAALNRHYTVNEVIPAISKAVCELLGPDQVNIIQDEGVDQAQLLESAGATPPLASKSDPRPVLIQDVTRVLGLMEPNEELPQPGYRAMGSWPLVYEDRTLAVIMLYYNQPHAWTQPELDVMQAFTRQAAIALENARLFDAEREQHILAEALRDLVTVVNSTLDYNEVLEKILASLGWVLPHDRADIMRVEEGVAHVVLSRGYDKVGLEKWAQSLRLPLKQVPVMQEIYQSGKVQILADTMHSPLWSDFQPGSVCRAYLGAPITRKGEIIGLINLYSQKPGVYFPRHAETLHAFSNQVAIALENASLYADLQEQADETSALYRAVTRLFTPGADQPALAEEIVQAVRHVFKSDHCSLLAYDETSGELKILAQAGYLQANPKRMQIDGAGLTVAAFNTGEVVYAPDVSQDPRYVSGTPLTRSEIVFPLRFQGEVMGVLNLESPELDAFGENERRLLSAFADRAAMALENARLFELTDTQLRQINLLNSITRASLESFDFPIMLAVMADRFRDLFSAKGCYIALWDDEQKTILPGMGSQIDEELELHFSPQPGELSLVETVLNSTTPLTIEKISGSLRVSPRFASKYDNYALLGLPLVVSQQKLGAVILLYERPHRFLTLEMRLAEQAAGQVALAIARARSLEASQRRAQEAENLRQATAALAAALDLRQVLDNILDHLEQVIPYDRACVYLLEEQTLHAVAVSGFASEPQVLGYNFPVSNALAQQIMVMSHPLILEDAAAEPRFTGWIETGHVHAWMGVPLIIHGSLIGFLTLGSQVQGTYAREQANLAQAFANQAAAAIANARLYSEVQRLAITDPLTGLYNRRGFSEIGHREVERTRRYKRPLSVILLDIDLFKNINDTYKHAIGDQVLRILAERCRKRTREVDIMGRYGGEEIVILLPETDRAGGLRAAEHLRRDVAEDPFETEVGPLWVTISLGVADSLNGECNLDELVDRADAAMYAAKQAGRNRVMSY